MNPISGPVFLVVEAAGKVAPAIVDGLNQCAHVKGQSFTSRVRGPVRKKKCVGGQTGREQSIRQVGDDLIVSG